MHTDIPKIYQFIDRFDQNLIKKKTINLGIIYRNYTDIINEKDLFNFKLFCMKKKYKLYLANNFKIALKYRLNGVYIPSYNKKIKINKTNLFKNFKILGSAHNKIEINKKICQGCEIIFISPLYKTKRKINFLDTSKFNLLTSDYKVKFIALGGISENNKKKIKMLNAFGYSGISIFQKKTGL